MPEKPAPPIPSPRRPTESKRRLQDWFERVDALLKDSPTCGS